jgi:hypothetical protein
MVAFSGVFMPGDITTLCDFTFHESTGGTLVDASGHGNHGHIHGASWQRINARQFCLSFDGSGFVRAPHDASLDLSGPFTISVWAKGHGGPLKWREMTSGDPPTRDPCFQVVGNKIYFATNTDIPHPHKRRRVAHHLLTGSVDTSGENWSVREHRFGPYSPVEPKLQVVGNEIHYGFFAVDRSQRDVTGTGHPGQFYTACSNLDGSDLRATPRLCSEEVGRRTEQSWLQVVGQRVYHAYVQMDDHGKWQLRTARSDVDGGDWRSVQRTTAGGWIPRIQAAGGGIYYYHGRYRKTHPQDTFTIARSDYDGGNWEVGVDLHDDFARPW